MQPNLEAEPHSENVVFIIQKPLFGGFFDHFKGGVRYIRFLKPIYQSRGGLRSRLHAPLFPPQVGLNGFALERPFYTQLEHV